MGSTGRGAHLTLVASIASIYIVAPHGTVCLRCSMLESDDAMPKYRGGWCERSGGGWARTGWWTPEGMSVEDWLLLEWRCCACLRHSVGELCWCGARCGCTHTCVKVPGNAWGFAVQVRAQTESCCWPLTTVWKVLVDEVGCRRLKRKGKGIGLLALLS